MAEVRQGLVATAVSGRMRSAEQSAGQSAGPAAEQSAGQAAG
jgi:hypothetical protein